MKAQKYLRFASVLIMIIGTIHICATPMVVAPLKLLGKYPMLAFTYMFVFTGIALVFAGWLQHFALKRLELTRFSLSIVTSTVLFISISAIGAVATMWTNPFAYLILFIALWEIYLVRLLPETIQKN
jgi:hypothetical protein